MELVSWMKSYHLDENDEFGMVEIFHIEGMPHMN